MHTEIYLYGNAFDPDLADVCHPNYQDGDGVKSTSTYMHMGINGTHIDTHGNKQCTHRDTF